jgi:hypothetical protein
MTSHKKETKSLVIEEEKIRKPFFLNTNLDKCYEQKFLRERTSE